MSAFKARRSLPPNLVSKEDIIRKEKNASEVKKLSEILDKQEKMLQRLKLVSPYFSLLGPLSLFFANAIKGTSSSSSPEGTPRLSKRGEK